MKNSSRFFENKDCEYFPCHQGLKEFNCLFCYCPFYTKEQCPGNPTYFEVQGNVTKDCSNCIYPHCPKNYDKIIEQLSR